MPVCKNNPKKSYKGTEPSPKGLGYCASGEKIGKKRKGKDGNMWQVKKISNGKRWFKLNNEEYKKIKSKTKGYKSYFIHDNGGRPFLVYVSKKDVQIYKEDKKFYSIQLNINDKKNKWVYIKLIKKYKPLQIFIGKSPLNNMTKFSGGHGKEFDGNSILLKIKKDRYVFIGNTIYEFSTNNDKILKYYSPVGNNDVPYPFAYGEKNVYFMLDNKYIPYEDIKELENKKETDGYNYYYGNKEKFAKKMKKVKYIQKRL